MTMQVDKARLDEIEAAAVALFRFDYPKDKWGRFGQKDYHPERYRSKARAALEAAVALRSLRSTEGKEGEDIDPILIEQLKRERNEALDQRNMTLTEMGKEMSRSEAAEARGAKLRDHVEQLVELLEIIKEHWVDYDHVYSIAVHEARAALTRSPE